MTNEHAPKSAKKFSCETCDFVCRSTYERNRHLMTQKHKIRTNTSEKAWNSANSINVSCLCGKQYKHASSLWNHKKKCVGKNEKIALDKDKLIEMLLEKNTELQSGIMDLLQKRTTQNNNHTMNHSHNKTINLNFFLNDTCKDAMNITDFVESIKIQLGDLDTIGESGFVSGITDIIVKELRTIDVNKRPLHCSDAKRETMYVRDRDKWEKEDDQNHKLNQMIDTLPHNNLKKLAD